MDLPYVMRVTHVQDKTIDVRRNGSSSGKGMDVRVHVVRNNDRKIETSLGTITKNKAVRARIDCQLRQRQIKRYGWNRCRRMPSAIKRRRFDDLRIRRQFHRRELMHHPARLRFILRLCIRGRFRWHSPRLLRHDRIWRTHDNGHALLPILRPRRGRRERAGCITS